MTPSVELVGGPLDGTRLDGAWVVLWKPVPSNPGRFYEYAADGEGRAVYRGVV